MTLVLKQLPKISQKYIALHCITYQSSRHRLDIPATACTKQVQHTQIVSIKIDLYKTYQLLPYILMHLTNFQNTPHKCTDFVNKLQGVFSIQVMAQKM